MPIPRKDLTAFHLWHDLEVTRVGLALGWIIGTMLTVWDWFTYSPVFGPDEIGKDKE
jgi:hypothetical protein